MTARKILKEMNMLAQLVTGGQYESIIMYFIGSNAKKKYNYIYYMVAGAYNTME